MSTVLSAALVVAALCLVAYATLAMRYNGQFDQPSNKPLCVGLVAVAGGFIGLAVWL